jgi:hypothetical protein
MKSDPKQFIAKNWKETAASACRWNEYCEELIGSWLILWEDAEADWQGSARVLAFNNGQFRYVSWSYGSCSGCDIFEDMNEEERRNEFNNNLMMHFDNINKFCFWINMLRSTNDSKAEQFIAAISSIFNDNVDWINDPDKLLTKINTRVLLK